MSNNRTPPPRPPQPAAPSATPPSAAAASATASDATATVTGAAAAAAPPSVPTEAVVAPASPKQQPPSHAATASSLPPTFSQLALTVSSARLRSGGGVTARALLRPNPYVEVIVDGRPPKRTETAKSTYHPKWNETHTLLVTPYSKLLFRLYDHSAFKRDSLMGEHTLDLFSLLSVNSGKLNGVAVAAPLKSRNSDAGGRASELQVKLDGMCVDLTTLPRAGVSVVPAVNGAAAAAATSSEDSGTSEAAGGVVTRPAPPVPPSRPASSFYQPSINGAKGGVEANSRSGRRSSAKLPSLPKETTSSTGRSPSAASSSTTSTLKGEKMSATRSS